MKPLVILTGPTAVGKTKLSIALAKAIDGEIISADSMQVYKKMDIGTAKITKEEMEGVPHYLVDEIDPSEDFNVVRFQECTKKYMDDIYSRGKIPILVGGTGFYIQAIIKDVDFTENDGDHTYRHFLEELAKEKGTAVLHQMLSETDPEAALAIHENNVKKVIRALEFYHQTGQKISEHNKTQEVRTSPYAVSYFVLNDEREKLYDRINRRVDLMMKEGLLDEVKRLKEEGYDRNLVSMQGIGYKEIYDYLSGEVSLKESIDAIKQNTRHFAKRQLTWFRREKDTIFVNKPDFDYDDSKMIEFMINKINAVKQSEE